MSVIHEYRLVAYVFGAYGVGSFRCGDFSLAGRIVYLAAFGIGYP